MPVDSGICQCLEHLGSNTRITHHSCSYNRDLRYTLLRIDFLDRQRFFIFFQDRQCILKIILCHCKGNIFCTVSSYRLKNDVHIDILLCKCIEDLERCSRFVFDSDDRNSRCIFVRCNSAD